MNVSLVLVRPSKEFRELKMRAGVCTVGRQGGCQIRVPVDTVSRQHAEFKLEGNQFTVRDLGSRNGTLVNGKRLAQAVLSAGDVITIGPAVFVVRVDGHPADVRAAAASAEHIPSNVGDTEASTRISPPPAKPTPGKPTPMVDPDDSSIVEFDFLNDDDEDQPKL